MHRKVEKSRNWLWEPLCVTCQGLLSIWGHVSVNKIWSVCSWTSSYSHRERRWWELGSLPSCSWRAWSDVLLGYLLSLWSITGVLWHPLGLSLHLYPVNGVYMSADRCGQVCWISSSAVCMGLQIWLILDQESGELLVGFLPPDSDVLFCCSLESPQTPQRQYLVHAGGFQMSCPSHFQEGYMEVCRNSPSYPTLFLAN